MSLSLIELRKIPFLAGRRFERPAPAPRWPRSLLLHPTPLGAVAFHPVRPSDRRLARIIAEQKLPPAPLPLLRRCGQTLVPDVIREQGLPLPQRVRRTAAPAVGPRLGHQAGTHRVPLDVAGAAQEVPLHPDHGTFEPPLPQVPDKAVLTVVVMHVG